MQQTYSLDPFGNFNQSGTLSFQPGMQGKNQFMQNGMGYDNAGNVTAANFGAGETNYGYDGANRMFNVNNGADYYTYDAAGDRMRKDTANGWTEYQYLNGQAIAEKSSTGLWSDYIYANGRKIARADSYDARIHLHGTQCSNCGWSVAAWDLPLTNYVIKQGDKVSWRQAQGGGAVGGYTIKFTDGTLTAWNTSDTNGQVMNELRVSNQWVFRTVDLSSFAGKTIAVSWVVADGDTAPGDWDEFYSDLAIASADGTVTPIYTRQASVGLSYFGSPGMTNLSGVVEFPNTPSENLAPFSTTTYYHGDHLGSTRMTTAGGGWATASDTFYPYGQEPAGSPSPNHFQYAGLERDPETGLDHATFRQYSATMGRWTSPDPYDGSMDLGNPQSLNRYNYAGNNPLRYTDPSGLDPITFFAYAVAFSGGEVDPLQDILAGVLIGADVVGEALLGGLLDHPTLKASKAKRPSRWAKLAQTAQCASKTANQFSIAGVLNIDEAAHPILANLTSAFLGNTFSGISDTVTHVFTGNLGLGYADILENGTRLGLPGSSITQKGVVGLLTEGALNFASRPSTLLSLTGISTQIAEDGMAGPIGLAKGGIDLATYLGSAAYCANHP